MVKLRFPLKQSAYWVKYFWRQVSKGLQHKSWPPPSTVVTPNSAFFSSISALQLSLSGNMIPPYNILPLKIIHLLKIHIFFITYIIICVRVCVFISVPIWTLVCGFWQLILSCFANVGVNVCLMKIIENYLWSDIWSRQRLI